MPNEGKLKAFEQKVIDNQCDAILDEMSSNFKVYARVKPTCTPHDKTKQNNFQCIKNSDTDIWVDTDSHKYSNFYSVSWEL